MRTLSQYLLDISSHLTEGETGIIVFDIDDTLVHADKNSIKLWKCVGGDRHNQIAMSTDEYAKDPDAKIHKDWYDYREFNDPVKVMTSIINGTPILKNLKILDSYINAGYEFAFLTARGCEDAVKYAINTILHVRDGDGNLKKIGSSFNKKMSAAVNDFTKGYEGHGDQEKKANVLKKICEIYDHVVFVDDDMKNVDAAKSLNISNLKVIKAFKI